MRRRQNRGQRIGLTASMRHVLKAHPEIVAREATAAPVALRQQPEEVRQFDALVDSLRRADPTLTFSAAIIETAKRNPDLAARRNNALRTLASE